MFLKRIKYSGFFILICFLSVWMHKSYCQSITPEENYARNAAGIVTVQTIFSATVYVNKVEINERVFNKLVDSVKRIDTSKSILSPQQKLDIVIKVLYNSPFRFFNSTDEYLMQQHRIVSTGTGFFISGDGYLVTNCHIIDRDSAYIRSKFILSTYQEVMDDNIRSLQSSWGMTLTDEQKNLLYSTYGVIYSRFSSMILFDLKKDINVLYRIDNANGQEVQQTQKAQIIVKGQAMPGKDVAILKVNEGKDLPCLKLSSDSMAVVGEQILVLGYPEPVSDNSFLASEAAIEPTLTSGIISAIKKSVGGWPVIQMDATTSHGSSGSPVCNAKGEVVGIVTFGSLDESGTTLASGFNFAIPISIINEFISKTHIHPQLSESSVEFNSGLNYYYSGYYSKALAKFEKAKELNEHYPQLGFYTTQSKNKVNGGEDHHDSSTNFIFLVFGVVILLALLFFFIRGLQMKNQKR